MKIPLVNIHSRHRVACHKSRVISCALLFTAICLFAIKISAAGKSAARLSADSLPTSYYISDMISVDSLASSFDRANGGASPVAVLPSRDVLPAPSPDADPWWQSFGSEPLVVLINTAVANNYNVKAALKRIESSRQMLRQTYSGLYPTLGLNAGYNIAKESGKEAKPYGKMPTESYFSLGASMQWEIDIFGRIAAKARGSKASLNLSRLEYDAVMINLAANVADEYTSYMMYSRQLGVARHHLNQQDSVLKITEARYKAGLVSKLDVAQAQNMVSNTRLMIPELEADVSTASIALATLCNISAEDVNAIMAKAPLLDMAAPLSVGAPADLLRRRPDIAEAEQQIESAASDLGVARKDYLPSLSIAASVGTSAHRIDDLFSEHSLSWSVAPQLSWTLFDGFSREAGIAEARAEMEAEIESYNMTVSTALQEVENAIANYRSAVSQLDLYDDVVKTAQEVVDLSIERYKLGLTDFSDVSSALITLLENETSYLSARGACMQSIISIYKALGGGW